MKLAFGVGQATTTGACFDAPMLTRRKSNLENGFFGITRMYRPQAVITIPKEDVAAFTFQAKFPETRFDSSVYRIT